MDFGSLADKDYVSTSEGLLFNVIGYDHSRDYVTTNLKYVDGQKWRAGYFAAWEFLGRSFPTYVCDSIIVVPRERIERCFLSRDGLARLGKRSSRSPIQSAALELASALANELCVPLDRFGLTDSLLWGGENESSDIDLVVSGSASAERVLDAMRQVYSLDRFTMLGPNNFSRDPEASRVATERMCRRRLHKGLFDQHRFSLRAVRDRQFSSGETTWGRQGPIELSARITGRSESLFFPATYQVESGPEVVSFMAEHEAFFRVGDTVAIRGELEQADTARIVVSRPGHILALAEDA